VTEIGSSAIQKSGVTTGTQESKDFKVVVTLENPSRQLKPGLSANADIITAQKSGVLAAPISALVLRDKAAAAGEKPKAGAKSVEEEGLFIVDKGRAKFVPVQKGITGELMIEISAGLQENQEIISGPYDVLRALKDGELIKAETKAAPTKK
jgi:HlyD family secretion protein